MSRSLFSRDVIGNWSPGMREKIKRRHFPYQQGDSQSLCSYVHTHNRKRHRTCDSQSAVSATKGGKNFFGFHFIYTRHRHDASDESKRKKKTKENEWLQEDDDAKGEKGIKSTEIRMWAEEDNKIAREPEMDSVVPDRAVRSKEVGKMKERETEKSTKVKTGKEGWKKEKRLVAESSLRACSSFYSYGVLLSTPGRVIILPVTIFAPPKTDSQPGSWNAFS
ncbi:hypothetical protein GGU10DRAFT_332108 [Lentinula aff. detonsa]|uniref:Uncharacterized protein n=1 Tax=Lentinula aff. detonsa TaxID=2804958 RepID=A0AA38KFK6_9AGAR|nr:hypothetical protein GGU10DRAFT_332108 [Lentinula aff. detonsa]